MRFIILALGAAAWCSAASAGTYVIEETQSRVIACYERVYVPAKVAINTRGKLVRSESRDWDIAGDSWNYVRNPPVYIQTRHVIDPDHYTLVGSACK